MSETDHQILSLLLDVREKVAGMSVEIKRVSHHLDNNTDKVDEMRESVAAIRARSEDHTGRIMILDTKMQEQEKKSQDQSGFRSKLGGIWIGVALVVTALASVAALSISLFKK
mgnify:CR=1 FL=1